MTGYERVRAALDWAGPDRIPIRHITQAGALHEHGPVLYDIWAQYPQDFGALTEENTPIIHPNPKDFSDGEYCREVTDEWGVRWRERTFGQMGHVVDYRIQSADDLKNLVLPPVPARGSAPYESEKRQSQEKKARGYYNLCGWIPVFEVMHALRRMDDILMDLADDNELVHTLADRIVERQVRMVHYYLEAGADGIQFADDWGSQTNTIISLENWRRFFKPLYARLFAPALAAGKDVFFHSCGHTLPLVEELAGLGVKAYWPQLGTNDNRQLASRLRQHKMTILWDIDRQHLMPFGTPEQVEEAVAQGQALFGDRAGGLIWEGELFPGYPLENIRALYRAFHINK
jgi:uroporphyrinogen decarboxylase